MIGTVRNVSYKFVRPTRAGLAVPAGALPDDTEEPDDDQVSARRNGRAVHARPA